MRTKKKQNTRHNPKKRTRKDSLSQTAKVPFVEHVQELRRRLYYMAASVLFWGCVAYSVQQHIVSALVRPARGEHFIYTSPGGGIDFLFRICIYTGIVFSLPVIVYNILRFIEPLITKASGRFILIGSFMSALLAVAGVTFGYYLGLPAALHFLLHQFTTVQIQPLVTIQSYLGFVIVYMVGSAMLFQVPLLLLFINRIKPLQPRRLLRYERWVILAAFVLAGLMNPSPNVVSQLLVAVPFILMYQVGILLIAIINRQHKPGPVEALHQQDVEAQVARKVHATNLKPVFDASFRPQEALQPVAVRPLEQADSQPRPLVPGSRPPATYVRRATPARSLDGMRASFPRPSL